MRATLKVQGNTNYLHIIRTVGTTIDDIKRSRTELALRFRSGSQRVLSDCRALDFESVRLIDADTLARDLKDDLPACRKAAIITRSRTTAVLRHFQNLCRCYGIEAAFFTDPVEGLAWLCSEEEARSDDGLAAADEAGSVAVLPELGDR